MVEHKEIFHKPPFTFTPPPITHDQNRSMATNPQPIAAYPQPKPIHDGKPMTKPTNGGRPMNKAHPRQQTHDQNGPTTTNP